MSGKSPDSLGPGTPRSVIVLFGVVLQVGFVTGPLFACGPSFPNYLLVGGDQSVLGGAEVRFTSELGRMKLVRTRHKAAPARIPFPEESRDAELSDLEAALKRSKTSDEESGRILSAHAHARSALTTFLAEVKTVEQSRPWVHDGTVVARGEPTLPWPKMPPIQVAAGLPGEFADYFEGALSWHNPFVAQKDAARQCWERLLSRPEAERKFKSVWAAFMLGRSWLEQDPEKAIGYLRQTRTLAARGFADPIGLAAASLGIEARLELLRTNYPGAIELYLQQLAAGDPGSAVSLRFLGAKALRSDATTLQRLAANPISQRVLTAYILSQPPNRQTSWLAETDQDDPTSADLTRSWLDAIEAAGIKDAESAEKLALAAYQANEMGLAQRWVKLAPNAPVAQWVQAKLLLRSGRVAEAASVLTKVVSAFPVEPRGTNRFEPFALKDTLVCGTCEGNLVPVERQALGELGVLRLARREFVMALDALLRGGFWMDAAYVAERVLTLDELKAYVDSAWPPLPAQVEAEEKEKYASEEVSPARLREQIRYLLARRLTRCSRSVEAREYYPERWLAQFDALVQFAITGWDSSLGNEQRAAAFFQAAIVTRTNGMELIGTEVEPDWHIHDGNFEEGVSLAERSAVSNGVLRVTAEEIQRASEHHPSPDLRFHYRYQAASLAWEAAGLLPDNSDFTAYVLWRGGSWLKYQDPPTADYFYKALVRRNRKTLLGAEADRRRWFPELDENGNIIPRRASKIVVPDPKDLPAEQAQLPESLNADVAPLSPESSVSDQTGQAGENFAGQAILNRNEAPQQAVFKYVVHKGDTLGSILRGLEAVGLSLRRGDLLRWNPDLDFAKLKVGQVVLLPLATGDEEVPGVHDATQ